MYVDLYNAHMNAGSTEADLAARRANVAQLAAYVANRSAGNAVIVMGDTNTRYTRAGDTIRDLTTPLGLTDAWVRSVRGGTPPAIGAPAITCDDANVTAQCEVVDKILYRGNRLVDLALTSYSNDNAVFRTADDRMLSDHYPIAARFSWSFAGALRASDQFGGSGGTPFTDVERVGAAPSSVTVRSGSRVDQVALTLADGTVLAHGGTGGSAQTLTLGAGEHLTSATVSTGSRGGGTRVFGITLRTSLGRTLTGGTATAGAVTLTAPPGHRIAGLDGPVRNRARQAGPGVHPDPLDPHFGRDHARCVRREPAGGVHTVHDHGRSAGDGVHTVHDHRVSSGGLSDEIRPSSTARRCRAIFVRASRPAWAYFSRTRPR